MSRSLGGTVHIRFAPDRLPRPLAHLLVLSLVLTVLPVPQAEPRPEAVWVEDVGGSDAVAPLYDQPPFPFEDPHTAEQADTPAAPADEGSRKLSSYTVEAGDTLSKIAARFKVSVDTLVWANDLADPDLVVLGARLFIPPADGVLHRVRPGDTVAELVQFYGSDLQRTIQVNDLEAPFVILVGQRLLLPDGKMPALVHDPAPAVKAASPSAPDARTPRQDGGLAASVEVPPARVGLPAPPNATPHQAAFILTAAEAARESQGKTGVPASVTIAQAILESYWGTSRLSRENNNYFGIKARERPGTAGVVWYNVWEVINGANVVQPEPFRAYRTAADSFVDHGWFFHNNGRYAGALAARGDPKQFAREINRAGYATDPAYAPKLIGLMDRFNLYAYDLK